MIVADTAVATPGTAAETETAQLEVLISTLNVRSGPGAAYPIIGTLKAGNQVEITGQDAGGRWWEICCVDGKPGWVVNNENHLRVLGDVDSVLNK